MTRTRGRTRRRVARRAETTAGGLDTTRSRCLARACLLRGLLGAHSRCSDVLPLAAYALVVLGDRDPVLGQVGLKRKAEREQPAFRVGAGRSRAFRLLSVTP